MKQSKAFMMKKLIPFVLFSFLFLHACKEKTETSQAVANLTPISADMAENAVIYEANIRQYSPQGTFNAFTKDIPVLKELGVKIIWVMPINPISKVKRKAKGDLFTSEIEDPAEREKYLGSYYSVSDYKAINPEFGSLEDFKNLVATAHKNGIYVIVDWVPNHTGWDHPWIYEYPDYYTQNEAGEIIDPSNPETGASWGWTDTADLNYNNPAMRTAMIDALKYWVEVADIDGYRMDVAHQVPVDFFEKATASLQEIKPVFMLAEAEQPNLMEKAFDMHYAWEFHHLLNDISKGHKNLSDLDNYLAKMDAVLAADDINMNFITNHDENSWAGTIEERMPGRKEIFTALTYTLPGMPLIYSGQEYDLNHRLKFFEKDSFPKTKGAYFELLKKLGALKKSHPALNGGKSAAAYKRLNTDNSSIFAFKRGKSGREICFVGNFSNETQQVQVGYGKLYTDYLNGTTIYQESAPIELAPWGFKIITE
ncbi:MAG: alpha-amylase family glycosyl hydrolase [Flavobacteriaceae bacterium]|nr:alpha-amylase family glycosyl hydrolase [Flavobacteriaceae bacterium]